MSDAREPIAVIGTGYVGLVTAVGFAELGNEVWCVDIDAAKIEGLRRGEMPIYEPGLAESVAAHAQRLHFSTELAPALEQARLLFVAVGTPPTYSGDADLSAVHAVIAAMPVSDQHAIVMKSTVPVGTGAAIRRELERTGKGGFAYVSCPEFLKEGAALADFRHPDRVVIGDEGDWAGDAVVELYAPLGVPLLRTDVASAEMVKLASNAFLATKISFINEIANVCEETGANVLEVAHGMGLDRRIGEHFLKPGIGYGGSCLLGEETLLVRAGGRTTLMSFEQLWTKLADRYEVSDGMIEPHDLKVLSWVPGEPEPLFLPVLCATRRDYDGEVVDVRTKMGRRLSTTADHPWMVSDGHDSFPERKLASELSEGDWVPLAMGGAEDGDSVSTASLLTAVEAAEIDPRNLIVRPAREEIERVTSLAMAQRREVFARAESAAARTGEVEGSSQDDGCPDAAVDTAPDRHPNPCEYARYSLRIRATPGLVHDHPGRRPHPETTPQRTGTLRLDAAWRGDVKLSGATLGTTKNGTHARSTITLDHEFWRVVGLYIAEGCTVADGDRRRIQWSFHPHREQHLIGEVADFWARHNVRASVTRTVTSQVVKVSSRLLGAWWTQVLGLGRGSYEQRLPDLIWERPEADRWALLSGLFEGDGSWSLINGGPSVIIEFGTVSDELADGVMRLLASVGIVASRRVGRVAKSARDTHWIRISGADQVERAIQLVPERDRPGVLASVGRQQKRIAPTDYRRVKDGTAWVRVVETAKRHFRGPVYSLEVPYAHTIVTDCSLVLSNCFPKDVSALKQLAGNSGYHFQLLTAVIEVNELQKRRVIAKLQKHLGTLVGKRVALLGLAFKAETDDMREASSLVLAARLQGAGAVVSAYDPVAAGEAVKLMPGVEIAASVLDAVRRSDAIVLVTEWPEFATLDWTQLARAARGSLVIDGRNFLDGAAARAAGFTYEGIGR